jgi:exosortase/archaeosortase family protein
MNDVNERENHSTDRSTLVWMVSFLALVGIFYCLDQTPWLQEAFVPRLSRWTAGGTVFILSFLGLQLKLAGSTIIGPSLRLEIAASCSGSFVFLMFAAAVIPFPAPWKVRLKGLMMGLLTLLLINLLRTSLIVLVVNRFPGSLWTFHIVIGQVMVIVAMMGVFLWWAKRTRGETSPPFLKKKRAILRVLLLFCVGYVGAYIPYQIFLESRLGLFTGKLIEIHMQWVLSFFNTHFFIGHLPSFSPVSVQLVAGCLSSPIVVLLVAVVFAWPAKWWKRLLVIFLGFIPFFYGYHLFRAVLVSLTLGFQTKNVNLVYNFYGQVFLVLVFFGVLGYLRCSRQKVMSYPKYLRILTFSCIVALAVAAGFGWLANYAILPWLVEGVSGSMALSYDPEQAVSTMLPVWVFIWLALVGVTPNKPLPGKSVMGLLGILVALALYVVTIILFETFHMAPHKGLLKLFVIFLPVSAYWAYLTLSGKKRTDFRNEECLSR